MVKFRASVSKHFGAVAQERNPTKALYTHFLSSTSSSCFLLVRANTRSLQLAHVVLELMMYGSSMVRPADRYSRIEFIGWPTHQALAARDFPLRLFGFTV